MGQCSNPDQDLLPQMEEEERAVVALKVSYRSD